MKQVVYLISLSIVLFSCKKDKLEGDKAIFIGKWNWVYSTHTYNYCDGDPNTTEIIDPETEGNNYSMEFFENGVVKYYENGNYLNKDRLIFSSFGAECGYGENFVSYGLYLN